MNMSVVKEEYFYYNRGLAALRTMKGNEGSSLRAQQAERERERRECLVGNLLEIFLGGKE